MDVEEPLHLVRVGGTDGGLAGRAGVVHQQVERVAAPAVLQGGPDRVRECGQRREVSGLEGQGDGASALGLDRRDDLCGLIDTGAVGQEHVDAGRREGERGGATEAA